MTTATAIPAGTYTTDGVHSSAGFAVKHMLSTFRGSFGTVNATVTVDEDGTARLTGTVPVDSVIVKDENLQAHLQSPEFFDAELELFDGLKAIPPYDANDDVQPAPAPVAALREAFATADAVLVATPEY